MKNYVYPMVQLGITISSHTTNPDMGKALGRVRFVQGLLNLNQMKDINFIY